jgi:hypothetical protein
MKQGEVRGQVIDFGWKMLAAKGIKIGLSRIIKSQGKDERGGSLVGHEAK